VPLTPETLAAADGVLIVTGHACIDYAWIVEHARLVIDAVNATRRISARGDKIIRLGGAQ
jgi:UDP-N-acetyl-D-glucosamine dehydrogenase